MIGFMRTLSAVAALVLLFAICGAAPAEAGGQTVNILYLIYESGYPIEPLIISLDFGQKTVKLVNFYYQTQIFAVTKKGKAMSMPMNFLAYCDTGEIVKAYENTFGVPIDRHVIFRYEYFDYNPFLVWLDALCPLILDVPAEVLGDEEYTTINGNMKKIAQILGREYTPVTQAGAQELDAVGELGYFTATPERIWDSDDQYTMMMNDYQYWDAKNRAFVRAVAPNIASMHTDTVRLICSAMTGGTETDVTQEDIDAWSQVGFNFPADGEAYFTVPGFEGVEAKKFEEAGALTGISVYQAYMLTYDNEAMAAALQAFLGGE